MCLKFDLSVFIVWLFLNKHKVLHSQLKQIQTYSIIRVEDVRSRRVIQDEGFVKISAQTAQIFDIAALVEYTRFPE